MFGFSRSCLHRHGQFLVGMEAKSYAARCRGEASSLVFWYEGNAQPKCEPDDVLVKIEWEHPGDYVPRPVEQIAAENVEHKSIMENFWLAAQSGAVAPRDLSKFPIVHEKPPAVDPPPDEK
jgi:hypothetical protein